MRHLPLSFSILVLLVAACAPAGATPTPPPDATQGHPQGVLATPPHSTPVPPVILLRWQSEDCEALESDGENLSYGPCDGDLTTVPATDLDLLRLSQWQGTYASFDATAEPTPAGAIAFEGEGTVEATPAEKRAMAEWASLRYDELVADRTSAAWSLALDWHREGGIAGFCDEVTVYLTGDYLVNNCKNPTLTPLAAPEPALPPHLTPGQLEQLYGWYDTLTNFAYTYTDPAVSDAMTTRFIFSGVGTQSATDQDVQEINAFASGLLVEAAYPPAALAAEQALGESLGVPVSEITIVSVTPEEWPDSCLGAAPPDVMCAQVITPGYLVVLEANGMQYTYRTDQTGDKIAAEPSP
jgi:hypothetical protein